MGVVVDDWDYGVDTVSVARDASVIDILVFANAVADE